MKNLKFNLINFLFNFLVVLFISVAFFGATPNIVLGSAVVAFGTGTVLSFTNLFKNVAFMALNVEIWSRTIQEKLLTDNTFLQHFSNVDDANILNGKIVHLPQAGEPSAVVKNRTVFPSAIGTRTDSEILYQIDEYTTNPIRIAHSDTVEMSYDKRMSILNQDLLNLSEEVAEGMLTNVIVSPVGDNAALPAGKILATDSATTVAPYGVGKTGTRKAYSLKDLQRMRNLMIYAKSWSEGNMYALITPEAAVQMFPAESAITATYMQAASEAERRAGVIYKASGWNILVRSSVYALAANKTFKPISAIVAANDIEGCLFWNKNMVEKAIGMTEAFENLKDPTFYGDIFSFLVRMGGRARRKNFEGVAVLVQENA